MFGTVWMRESGKGGSESFDVRRPWFGIAQRNRDCIEQLATGHWLHQQADDIQLLQPAQDLAVLYTGDGNNGNLGVGKIATVADATDECVAIMAGQIQLGDQQVHGNLGALEQVIGLQSAGGDTDLMKMQGGEPVQQDFTAGIAAINDQDAAQPEVNRQAQGGESLVR